MRLRPVSIILCVYFFSNIVYGLIFLNDGVLGGDFNGRLVSDDNEFVIVYVAEIFLMLLFFVFLYFISSLIDKRKNKKNTAVDFNENLISKIVFFVQLSFLLYSAYTGIGKLSEDYYNTQVNNPLKYFFSFFNADYLFLTYFTVSKRYSKSNIILYLISNLYRGWITGVLMSLFFIFIIKRFDFIKFKTLAVLGVVFVLCAPSLYFVKYVSRGAQQDPSFQTLASYYNGDVHGKVMSSIFQRFQHISETYSCIADISVLRSGYESKNFVPFYLDNFLKKPLSNVLNYQSDKTLTQYAAENILHKDPGNIHVGILPWLLIDPFLTFSFVVGIIISFYCLCGLISSLSNNSSWPIAVWATAVFAMHGWYSAFFMIIWSYFILKIINSIKLKNINV